MAELKRSEAAVEEPPRLVVDLGRGARGKSEWLRWVAETAPKKRPLRIIDADPDHQTLCQLFPEAVKPPSNEGPDRRAWIEEQIVGLINAANGDGQRHDMLLDLGGGDQLMKRLGAEVRVVEVLEESGVDVTAIYMVGPSEDDLSFMADVESKRLFCPKRTAVVLNAGVVPGDRSVERAFAPLLESDIIKAILRPDRGGKLLKMPALTCMPQLYAAGIKTFGECLTPEGMKKIGPFNAARVRNWLAEMAKLRTALGDWLP